MGKQIMLMGIMLVSTGGPLQAMETGKNSLNKALIQAQLGEDLIKAALYGKKNKVENLLNEGADINYRGDHLETALLAAARQNRLKIVCLLIANNAQVNYQDINGYTALSWAVYNNNPAMIHLLIENGAQVNHQDNQGDTALMKAAGSEGKLEIIRLLIENGANLNLQNAEGRTAIIGPTILGYFNNVHFLIEKGAELDHQDKHGNTALMYAAILEHFDMCKILVQAMLKLTKEQKDTVYTLIASLERTPSLQTSKDTRELIAQKLINEYKKENRAKTRAEIEKIENGELKNQLLQLLEK